MSRPEPPSLTEPMFLILSALADAERHGYAIMREVEEETAGAVRLGPGTLYRSLKRLLEEGLIVDSERRSDPCDPGEDERRRNYRITTAGLRAARAEADRLDRVLRLARRSALAPAAGEVRP